MELFVVWRINGDAWWVVWNLPTSSLNGISHYPFACILSWRFWEHFDFVLELFSLTLNFLLDTKEDFSPNWEMFILQQIGLDLVRKFYRIISGCNVISVWVNYEFEKLKGWLPLQFWLWRRHKYPRKLTKFALAEGAKKSPWLNGFYYFRRDMSFFSGNRFWF